MQNLLEDTKQSILLDEIKKEVLSNTIYYIDTNYYEILGKTATEEKKERTKEERTSPTDIKTELETVEEKIASLEREIESLKKEQTVETVEGTVDLNALLEKVSEQNNQLHPQDTSTETEQTAKLYKVTFTNTEIRPVEKEKIEALARIKNVLEKQEKV